MAAAFSGAAELAGFFLAHSVWSVSDPKSGPLIPLAAFTTPDGKRQMMRFVADKLEEGVAQARAAIEKPPAGALHGVYVFDGLVTLPQDGVKRDALIANVVAYGTPQRTLEIVLPYRRADDPKGFAVYKPKFTAQTGLENADLQSAGGDLFRGVDAHEQGSAVWNKHLDQSI